MAFRCFGKRIFSSQANTLNQRKLIASRCLYAVHRSNTTICSKPTLLIKHNYISLKHNRLLVMRERTARELQFESIKNTLISLFGFSESKVFEIINEYPDFKKISSEQMIENYNYFLNNSYKKDYLANYPFYLIHDKVNVLIRKELIKELKIPMKYEYQFFQLPLILFYDIYHYSKLTKNLYKPNIVDFLKNLLECSYEESLSALLKSKLLWMQKPYKIQTSVKLLFELGVTKNNLLQDPNVMCYTTSHIRSRLNGIQDNSPTTRVKGWLIHSSEDTYTKYVEKSKKIKSLLGDGTLYDYMAKLLNCSTDQIKEIFIKNKHLKNINPIKVDDVVKFCLVKGFTTQDILLVPKVFAAKISSLDKKLFELEKLEVRPKRLHLLCKSNKEFDAFIRKVLDERNLKEKNSIFN